MGKLAITGGKPVRKKPFPAWPVYSQDEARGLQKVLASRNWGGFPFPNTFADDFAHAHGGRRRSEGAGATGDVGYFSFQSSKLMTSGEGRKP